MNPQTHHSHNQRLPDVRADLRERLLTLPYAAFLRCIADLLEKVGYCDVQLSSRKDWRGRNGKDGSSGYDLTARLSAGGMVRRVVVQAKQFDERQRVFLSQIDALRGVCLRAGATEGLLLTTGPVSSRVPRPLLAAAAFVPARVLDGEELLDLLIAHQVGVWQELGDDGGSRYGLDDAYFKALELIPDGNNRADCAPVRSPYEPWATSHYQVTVSVTPMKKPISRRSAAIGSTSHSR